METPTPEVKEEVSYEKQTAFTVACLEKYLSQSLPNTPKERITEIAVIIETAMTKHHVVTECMEVNVAILSTAATVASEQHPAHEIANLILEGIRTLTPAIVGAIAINNDAIEKDEYTAEMFFATPE